jgi:hypothetical protein
LAIRSAHRQRDHGQRSSKNADPQKAPPFHDGVFGYCCVSRWRLADEQDKQICSNLLLIFRKVPLP